MLTKNQIITDVRNFIAKDELSDAIGLLSQILKNDKNLDVLIIQSAIKHRIEKEIRSGVLSYADASVSKNQVSNALLEICRDIEQSIEEVRGENIKVIKNQTLNEHFLHKYPRGPIVEGYLISEELCKAYARLIKPKQAMVIVEKANRLRKEADPHDDTVTILASYTLLSPLETKPYDFWVDTFDEARRHGPRMLAALLSVLPVEQFNAVAKKAREELLDYLINHE